MRIISCKTNHIVNPLGFQMDSVRLSYNIAEAAGKEQKCARIKVALDEAMKETVYDSGEREGIHFIGEDIPLKLKPRTRYFWTVRAETEKGETAESDVNWFETAKQDETWHGKWIACGRKNRHPIFYRDLSEASAGLKDGGKSIRSARLYICGLGLYEAFLNGEKIGDELLTPGCNNYDQWLQYQTYDITSALKKGALLEVMTGDGWYLGRFGFYSGLVKEDKESLYKLIAEIHVAYDDGTEEVIGTDESWQVKRSNITFSNIYDGEYVDDTLPETETEPVSLIEAPAPLTARYSLPVTAHEEFQGRRIESSEDELLVDFGQNMSGVFSLRVKEPEGTKIHLQFGEVLQEGHFYRDNLRTALAEYVYISDGKEHVLKPHFTFYGFRYVKISGISDFQESDLRVNAIYSDVEDAGEMTTSNGKVNRLIENIRWGERSNFVDVPTDCPQRDERMGWTGDAQVFSDTAMFLSDSYAFYRKYLHDMATEQREHEGMVPDVVPSFGVKSFSGVWGDACCIIPWNLYMAYGDLGILEEQYESMKSWVDFIRKVDGEDHNWRRQFHYGDWVALDSRVMEKDTVTGGTDEAYISDIYYYNSVDITARTARLLGYEEDAAELEGLAAKILAFLRKDYFSGTGRCCCDTQTAQVLALEFDIAVNRKMTADMLRTALIRSKGKLQTGFTGTPFLCKALCDNGLESMAYDLLLNEECPGWLYEVSHGATTVWERWNSVEEDGNLSSTGMNSLNHYAYGSVLDWMVKYAGGLRPACPGYTKALIAPVPDMRLGGASVSYQSIAGKYMSGWQIAKGSNGRKISVHFEIPFGCEAEIVLPKATEEALENLKAMDGIYEENESGKIVAKAGNYKITYTAAEPFTRIYTVDDEIRELQIRPDVVEVIGQSIPDFIHIDYAYQYRSLRDVVLHRTGDLYRDRQIDAAKIYSLEQVEEINENLMRMFDDDIGKNRM